MKNKGEATTAKRKVRIAKIAILNAMKKLAADRENKREKETRQAAKINPHPASFKETLQAAILAQQEKTRKKN